MKLLAGFPLLLVVLEVYSGCAFVGWAGDNMVVEKAKSPGPYWATVCLHLVIAVFALFLMLYL